MFLRTVAARIGLWKDQCLTLFAEIGVNDVSAPAAESVAGVEGVHSLQPVWNRPEEAEGTLIFPRALYPTLWRHDSLKKLASLDEMVAVTRVGSRAVLPGSTTLVTVSRVFATTRLAA